MKKLGMVILMETLLVVMFVSAAGRWDFPWYWAMMAIHAVVLVLMVTTLDPDLLKERLHPGPGAKDPYVRKLATPLFLRNMSLPRSISAGFTGAGRCRHGFTRQGSPVTRLAWDSVTGQCGRTGSSPWSCGFRLIGGITLSPAALTAGCAIRVTREPYSPWCAARSRWGHGGRSSLWCQALRSSFGGQGWRTGSCTRILKATRSTRGGSAPSSCQAFGEGDS